MTNTCSECSLFSRQQPTHEYNLSLFETPITSIPSPNFPTKLEFRKRLPVGNIVSAIVLDSDRFYKPRLTSRRCFTLQGVIKFYPTVEDKLRKNTNTFLHKKKYPLKEMEKTQVKAPQNFEESFSIKRATSLLTPFYLNKLYSNLILLCKLFLKAEMIHNYMEHGTTIFPNKGCETFNENNDVLKFFPSVSDSSVIVKRLKKSGVLNSFPRPSTVFSLLEFNLDGEVCFKKG